LEFEFIKAPSPMRLLCGGVLAYWLSGFVNPAFVAIAVMIVLFIPIFIADPYATDPGQSDINQQPAQPDYIDHDPIDNPTSQRLRNDDKQSKGR